ncbi:MAG: efflux RND transporter periplasmic adaptor subunit [Pseudomonadota bacterium]
MAMMRWTVTIGGCLLVLGALGTFKFREIQAGIAAGQAYPEQSETVEEARVSTAEFTPNISVMGEIVAPQRLDLRNEIEGEITKVNFRSGEPVRAGQLLIQLDTSVEQASLEVARARAELAQRTYDRNLQLFESRLSTQDLLDRAKADLSAAQAEVHVLERTIEKKTLTSPFAGRAGLHNFEVGQYLESNTLVANLVGDTGDMWIDFQVPQFYPQLGAGSDVLVKGIGSESSEAAAHATIIAENTVVNTDSRSRGYRATIADDQQRYTPQTMVKLEVPVAGVERLLKIPATAVQQDPLGQYVFMLNDDPAGKGLRAKRQQVEVRTIDTDFALLEQSSGLKEGDRIAAAGAFKLYEGILVFTRERNAVDTAEQGSAAQSQTVDPAQQAGSASQTDTSASGAAGEGR